MHMQKVRGKKQAKRVMMKAMQEDWDTRFKKYVESGEMCLQIAYDRKQRRGRGITKKKFRQHFLEWTSIWTHFL